MTSDALVSSVPTTHKLTAKGEEGAGERRRRNINKWEIRVAVAVMTNAHAANSIHYYCRQPPPRLFQIRITPFHTSRSWTGQGERYGSPIRRDQDHL
ncbi:hypothetical protein DPV78_012914 [Talaromyces pinophilus]|nr:hypothetical protein DPV78_012914 [Talaromyces pinophilus]